MTPHKFRVILLFLCLTPISLFAQQADTTDYYSMSLEELMNIPVTTASKFEQTIKTAPSTMSLITRDQINKYGWISGNEVLSRLPGFSPSQDYDRPTVSSRGIYEGWNNNHMLMLIDGVPMNDNMYGTAFTWEITPLVFTKSLEVIRGPGSALYGSNATNGVISYNTISAKDMNKKTEVRYRLGSKGSHIVDLLTAHENDNVSFVSAFNFFETQGDTYKTLDARGTAKFDITNKRSNYYFFTKIEPKGKLQGLSMQFHEQAWNFNTGHGWLFYVPDQPESMNENRRLISLRYKTPDTNKPIQQEYLMRYQRHGVNWNTRLSPDTVFGYPNGITEILKTQTSDLFTRLQWSTAVNAKTVLLGGIENSFFRYNGDDSHISNVNLHQPDLTPTDNNEFVNLGEYFEWLGDNPFINTAAFAQFSTGLMEDKLKATLGIRYDYATFDFINPDGTEESKSYSRPSPRLSLVYSANEGLSFKLMAGQAFRTPAPSELFGSNTFLLASNIRQLKPEVITTVEVGMDYSISNSINWRLNAYHTTFEDQIAYSVSANNLSTNLYSLTTVGIENEFTFKSGSIDGFLNHSFARRLDEEIVDSTIFVSKSELTWVPSQLVNVGLKYSKGKYNISTQVHYQGDVQRRNSDKGVGSDELRGVQVDSWATLDFRFAYKVNEHLEIAVNGNNITDTKGYFIKTTRMPFDYQMPGRLLLLDLRFMF
ncbi:MAG TPA: TonB-dependent receptor [Chryseosolibacter sp.]|nr:TonB-dependent receptor [Chryseosolibacter sp.]